MSNAPPVRYAVELRIGGMSSLTLYRPEMALPAATITYVVADNSATMRKLYRATVFAAEIMNQLRKRPDMPDALALISRTDRLSRPRNTRCCTPCSS